MNMHGDQKWLLAGAALAFLTAVILSIIHGCSETLVGIALGSGASAVGAMGGNSRTSATSAGTVTTTAGDPPVKTEVKTE